MTTARQDPQESMTQSVRRYWDEQAPSYERMGRFERFFIGDSREWVCGQARGDTLEIAAGTGRNLGRYGDDVQYTGIDISPGMLDIARRRAAELALTADLREADAQQLPFADASFDSVVSTLSLCAVPDLPKTVAETYRVLRPGGRLLLLDHVRPNFPPLHWLLRGMQWGMNRSTPGNGEQLLRRPMEQVVAQGFVVDRSERFKGGAIERLAAHKPA